MCICIHVYRLLDKELSLQREKVKCVCSELAHPMDGLGANSFVPCVMHVVDDELAASCCCDSLNSTDRALLLFQLMM